LGALLALLIVARFTGLDRAPPGFYVDEAAIAAQVICLRTTGADADGNPWPLFAPVLGGAARHRRPRSISARCGRPSAATASPVFARWRPSPAW